jgi:hypothetical protein
LTIPSRLPISAWLNQYWRRARAPSVIRIPARARTLIISIRENPSWEFPSEMRSIRLALMFFTLS